MRFRWIYQPATARPREDSAGTSFISTGIQTSQTNRSPQEALHVPRLAGPRKAPVEKIVSDHQIDEQVPERLEKETHVEGSLLFGGVLG